MEPTADAEELSVELFVPCERVSAEDGGLPLLDGAISRIVRRQFPSELRSVALYTEIWATPYSTAWIGAHVIGPDGAIVAREPPEPMAFDGDGMTLFALVLDTVPLPAPGVYAAVLVHDEREIARRRFRVEVEVSTATRTVSR